jgi:hypothetical protein
MSALTTENCPVVLEKRFEISFKKWQELTDGNLIMIVDHLYGYADKFLKDHPNLELLGTSPLIKEVGYNLAEEKMYIRFFVKEKKLYTFPSDGEALPCSPPDRKVD